MVDILKSRMVTSLEISMELSISEKEVFPHLEHIARSMSRDFVVEPARCRRCGFVFTKRQRLTMPSRCPRCKGESIERQRFGIRER